MRHIYGPSAWLLLLASCLVTGCGEPDQIRTYEVPKRAHWRPRIAMTQLNEPAQPPIRRSENETILAALVPKGDDVLVVKLRGDSKLAEREKENFRSFVRSLVGPEPKIPDGWEQAPRVQFASISLMVTEAGNSAKITVSPMPAASVALVPNVNRWRRQIGLPPATEKAINEAAEELKIGDTTAKLFAFTSEDSDATPPRSAGTAPSETILAALLPKDDKVLVVKLRGESKLAKREKENFLTFVRSLAEEKHSVPDGWQEAPDVQFATISLSVANDDHRAIITVSPMPPAAVSLVPNVNRWRRQLGLPPSSREEIESVAKEIKVGDTTAKFFELVAPHSS